MTPAGRVELHTHLEGSVTPARLILLADKYGQPGLPAAVLNEDGSSYRFEGFHGFLDAFKHVTSLLRTPGDFHAVARDLGGRLKADGVAYAEISLSYGVLLKRNIDPVTVQSALAEAAAEVRETNGVEMRWIPDAVRQWDIDWGWRAWEAATRAGRGLGVVGFGLGGDEADGPAADFADIFAEVKAEGFGVTIHAGEMPAMGAAAVDSIRQAIDECGADRIGHGLAAVQDPLILATLAARDVFVEMCPGSNVQTGGISAWSDHPLREILDAGVPCCLNTDDRAMFGLDLEGEYRRAAEFADLSTAEHDRMQNAARQAAFHDFNQGSAGSPE
ncbi:MAG: adenosine deaminase [Candidatus Krumholzibacteriota bacterium]